MIALQDHLAGQEIEVKKSNHFVLQDVLIKNKEKKKMLKVQKT